MAVDDYNEKIVVEKTEFKVPLYRHWNLYDGMCYSPYVASKLGTWTENGKKTLNTLLVKLGLPLDECKNKWTSMNIEAKKSLRTNLQRVSAEFGLHEITYTSFVRNIGYKIQLSAGDVVYGITSLLESQNGKSFWQAYDALSRNNTEQLIEGLHRAITIQQAIYRQGTSLITNQAIVRSGPFRYAYVAESSDLQFFSKPQALVKLALFIEDALVDVLQQKSKALALISLNEVKNVYLVTGLMPTLPSTKRRNQFGIAYESAARKTSSRILSHYFDAAVIGILRDDIKKFTEYLHSGVTPV